MYDRGECQGECGRKDIPIVNKTHKLCQDCNGIRLKSSSGTSLEPKKTSLLKQVSDKESKNRIELSIVYKQIDIEREPICEGCGNPNNLSHSHLIARSSRKDLETDKKNIKLHCLERLDGSKGCHARWESMNWLEMKSLKDFESNLEYIKSVDIPHYNLILSKKPVEIQPISEIDQKILSEILEALKIGNQGLLVEILKQYKQIPDAHILNLLKRYIVDYEPEIEDTESNPMSGKRKIIIIANTLQIDVKNLESIEKDNSYNPNSNEMEYRIMVNKDNTGMRLVSANTLIKFSSENARDLEFSTLQKKLEMYNIIFI